MRDQRLDLGRYITNPFNQKSQVKKQLNFDDLFRAKASTGQYPWNPSRFDETDLLRKMMTRKRQLNPDLNFIPNSPFFDNNEEVNQSYELFEGLGRFNRPEDYDFNEGRAMTAQRPQDQPDFNPAWVEAYRISPTLNPQKVARNPMPRMKNPDPNGYLMSIAEQRVENEADGNVSVAQLLERKNLYQSSAEEEREGEDTVRSENVSPGKTVG
jgi:hypothetical protein